MKKRERKRMGGNGGGGARRGSSLPSPVGSARLGVYALAAQLRLD